MPSESERAVMAYFFAMRSAQKAAKEQDRYDRLYGIVLERSRMEELERTAERDAWERAWG